MQTVLQVENLSKLYRLGEIGTGTISHDLNRYWAKVRGKEDPYARVGTMNDRTQKSEKGEYVWSLKDIDFEVQEGEVLGIIGKNGAGKSTLLKILSRITAPTTGHVKIKGRVASLLEVGTGMHPEMTGRENVYLNGTILGMTRKEISAKFDDIMDFAGCAKYADTPVKRYSSGMKVRLGFAVAAFLEPEILIVDEVLAVGDAEFQKRAIGKMQDVSKNEGRTVLLVSHNMGSIQKLCNRTILLEKGIAIKNDRTKEVISYYTEKFFKPSEKISFRLDDIGRENTMGSLARLSHFKFISPSGKSSLLLGESFKVELGINKLMERPLDVDAVIAIVNEKESIIAIAITDLFHLNDNKTISFDFTDYKLNSGKYFINAILRKGEGNRLDFLKSVFFFEVLEIPCSDKVTKRPGVLLFDRVKIDVSNKLDITV